MDPAAVDEAARRLDPGGVEWVSYTCQLSGEKEAILLVGDEFASRLTELLPDVEEVECTKILAGLHSSELCECDVATLMRLPEDEPDCCINRGRAASGSADLDCPEVMQQFLF